MPQSHNRTAHLLAALAVALTSAVALGEVQEPLSIAVSKFRSLKSDAATAWIGEGIQQAIVADLSKHSTVTVRELAGEAMDADPAVAAGKSLKVDVVIVGTFQTSNDEVRATGRIVLTTGRTLTYISGRAPLTEVFRLQDDLARQVREAVVRPEPPAPPIAPADPTAVPPIPDPNAGAAPTPFEGSALDQALQNEANGLPPNGAAPPAVAGGAGGVGGAVNPPVTGSQERIGGWPGGGWGWGLGGYYYPPYYRPPKYQPPPSTTPPGDNSGTPAPPANPPGGGTGGGTPGTGGGNPAPGTITPPPAPPPRPKLYNPFAPK